MYAHLQRAARLTAFLGLGVWAVAGAQTRVVVPSDTVSAIAVSVSGAIGGRIITCPPKLGLSQSAVCLLASGNAATFKPKISAKFAGLIAQDWKTSQGGSNSLVIKAKNGLVFVLLAQAGADVLTVVSPPQGPGAATAPATTPVKTTPSSAASTPTSQAVSSAPAGAARGVAYVRAADIRSVISVAALSGTGTYRIGGAAQALTVAPGKTDATLNGADYTLQGAPFLSGGQLYLPLNALRDLDCTVTQTGASATVACNGSSVKLNVSSY